MATLTSTKIKNTYDALLKSIDNDAIGTTAKQITDGLGNTTPLYVSTTQVGIGVTPESGLNLHVYGDAKIGSNLTVIGNLVVEGSTTTVGTDTLTVKDPLIVLANNNTSTDAVDIGFYGKYTPSGTTLYSGLFREALTGKYRLFKGLEDEPTTTVNTSGTGYAVATLVSDLEGTLTGVIASTTTATTQSANDNSTKVATTAYVDNQVGLYDTLSEVLANGNTSGANDIIMEDSQKVNFGTDSDLEMYHDGTDGYIDNINGELILQNNSDNKKIIFKSDNGIGDITEYFRIDGNINRNVITVTTQLNDDVPLIFGDGAARPSIKYDSTATDLIVSTNGSTALTIDTSQNATFSGTISGVLADGVTATTQSDGDNSTKVATTAYVDTAIEGHDTLAEVLSGGNTTGGTDIAITAGDKITNFTSTGIDDNATSTAITIDSSGNVGINNATPTYPLDIIGNTFLTGNLQITSFLIVDGNLTIDSDTSKLSLGDDQDLQIYHDGSHSYINDSGTGDLIFTSGVNERMRIQSGGDISINEANPLNSAKFYVNGLGYSTAGWSVGNSSGTIRGRLTTSGSILQIQSEENNDIQIGDTTSANIIHIDTSEDSVGIGLTNPADYTADELVISVPDGSGMTLVSGSTDAAYIEFKDSTGAIGTNGGFVSYNHDTDTLQNFAQSKVSVAILEAEVAYFTDTAFYVDKSTTIDDTLTVSSSTATLNLTGSNTGASLINFADSDDGNVGRIYYDHTDNFMQFKTNDSEKLRIDSSGNVGIGGTTQSINWTDSPTLTIEGTNPLINLVDTTASSDDYNILNDDGVFRIFNDTDGRFDFNIDGTGNVGIGTSSPTAPLHVVNTSGGWSTYINNNVGSGTQSGLLLDAGSSSSDFAMYVRNAAGSSDLFAIKGNGNVGIGTTSPSAILEVEDSANNNANLLTLYRPNSSTLAASRLDFSFNTANGTQAIYSRIQSDVDVNTDSAQSGSLSFWTPSSGTLSERMRIDSSGDVSIKAGYLSLDSKANNSASVAGEYRLALGHDASTDASWIQSNGVSGTQRKLLLNPLGGNVGIGTDSPSSDISGSVTMLEINDATNNNLASLALKAGTQGSKWEIAAQSSNALGFFDDGTERMRITSGGDVFIANSSFTGRVKQFEINPNTVDIKSNSTGSGLEYHQEFSNPNGTVGSITTNGSATAFNTSSDYRLKENVVEMTGALDRVSQLKPSRFNFIADADKTVDGFLAHEVQEIVPEAITGEKDAMRTEEYEVTPAIYEDVVHPAEEAVYETIEHPAIEEELDDEGNVVVEAVEAYTEEILVTEAKEEWTEKVLVSEKVMGTREVPDYQGIDQSKLVPLLVGAIQELKAEIESLKQQINN